jgi:hypothetical protein
MTISQNMCAAFLIDAINNSDRANAITASNKTLFLNETVTVAEAYRAIQSAYEYAALKSTPEQGK